MGTDNKTDPTLNVTNLLKEAVGRADDLRQAEMKRIDDKLIDFKEKFNDVDIKYQIQFTAAKEAVAIASTAQEKLVAQALDGTKEAITKNDANTDKRFELLSEKIDSIAETISKNTGAQGIYVTHTDLSNEMSKLRADFEVMIRPVITYMNSSQGRSGGLNSGWLYLLGGLSAISAIISIFSLISK